MSDDPLDESVFGPATREQEEYLLEGVHFAGGFVAVPGVPRTNDPKKVTCRSCQRGAYEAVQ